LEKKYHIIPRDCCRKDIELLKTTPTERTYWSQAWSEVWPVKYDPISCRVLVFSPGMITQFGLQQYTKNRVSLLLCCVAFPVIQASLEIVGRM
jgi:hypothetical protein